MRFIICGVGAVGGVLAGHLAKAGFDVLGIEKAPEHLAAIQSHSLRLRGLLGEYTLPLPTVRHASAVTFQPEDVLVLAVKAFHCEAAVRELRHATRLELPLFCAQNGIANEGIAAQYFQHVHGMMVLVGAKRLVPGEVIHTGHGPIGLGTYPQGLSPVVQQVAEAFDATDLPVYTTDRIGPAKWHKLLLNLNNATLGLTGLGSHAWHALPEGRAWVVRVWEEGARVLQAAHIAYEPPPGMATIEEHIQALRTEPVRPAIPAPEALQGRSSLWQDLWHRRGQVEADALNGEIVRLGRQCGVPTPLNSLLLQLSEAMAAARALPGKYTVQQLHAYVQD